MTPVTSRVDTMPTPESRSTETPPTATRAASPCVVPALMTSGLLWLCYFPLSWGWLSWVALVPLLTLIRAQAAPRRLYWSAYLGGLGFFIPILQWMRVADSRMYATWMMLAFYCALYFPLALWLIRKLDQRGRVPLVVSVPLVWVGLEWVRSFLLTGFAWYYLGHAQHRWNAIVQIADLGGVYAVSLLVAAVNAFLADLLMQMPGLRQRFHWTEPTVTHAAQIRPTGWAVRPGLVMEGLVVATLVMGAVLYGHWRLEQTAFTAGPRVALLQSNLLQRVRNAVTAEDARMEMECLCYVATQHGGLASMVVWPETSYPGYFCDVAPSVAVETVDRQTLDDAALSREGFREYLVKRTPTNHLLGIATRTVEPDGKKGHYCSALFVDQKGNPGSRYDKIHRVPFGEFVPLRDWLPFMNVLAPYETDYSIHPGKGQTRFTMGDHTFGVLICYEDSDPFLGRRLAQDNADGKSVDFLVNISNDGWFDGTSEHEEHLVVSKFRAIEARRSMVRAVNMGVSAVIDGNGRILKPHALPAPVYDPNRLGMKLIRYLQKYQLWEVPALGPVEELPVAEYADFKKTAGVLLATVPIDSRASVYAAWGDWLPISGWVLVGLALVFPWSRVRPTPKPV